MPRIYTPRPIAERFWEKVDCTGDGCWEWRASTARTGYGKFGVSHQKWVAAHRIAFGLEHPATDLTGLHVLHRCDNPPCVRPSHLFLGTNHDNILDMSAKGRANHGGVHNGGATLDDAKVLIIIDRLAAGEPSKRIARDYGISAETINGIRRGQRWQHIERPDCLPPPWACGQ